MRRVLAFISLRSVRESHGERISRRRNVSRVHERVASKRKLESDRPAAEPIPCARAECERTQAPWRDKTVRRLEVHEWLWRSTTQRVLERRMTSASPDESECPARGMRPHDFYTEEDRR